MPKEFHVAAQVAVTSIWLFVTASASVAQESTFEDVEPTFRERLQRPSLWKRTEGRRMIAETRDLRALELLVRGYARPEAPKDVVRALCVHLGREFFTDSDHLAAWLDWRTSNQKAEHAWLWHAALSVEAGADENSWVEVAESRLPAVLRATAITAGKQARRRLPDEDTMAILNRIVVESRGAGVERELIEESVLSHFDRDAAVAINARHRTLLRSFARMLDDKRRSTRSKLVISRMLARILDRENVGAVSEAWLMLLEDEVSEAAEVDYARRRAAQVHGFFGIPDHSAHVVYVIDASDSMLAPLTRKELGVLTGVEEQPSEDERASRAIARAIDWSKVRTRFDAARELLMSSVRRLRADQRFAIVLFGGAADPLASTPKLIAPTAKNLEKVEQELYAIQPGPPAPNRPHGTLRGETNLHGGISRAFELTTKKRLKRDVHVAIKSFANGSDTIYVLSDGAPSWDDYDCVDTNDGKWAGDPEAGTKYEHTGPLHYYGPFAWAPYLVPDVRRLNMLRRAAIHTIGLGEADERLLEQIASVGHGEFVKIGAE